MAVHIGKIIQKRLKAKGISTVQFAKDLNFVRSNAYKLYEKESIDTAILVKINKILGENLFFYYINQPELDEKVEEALKIKLSLKAWNDFMTSVKTTEADIKAKKAPAKSKAIKKPK